MIMITRSHTVSVGATAIHHRLTVGLNQYPRPGPRADQARPRGWLDTSHRQLDDDRTLKGYHRDELADLWSRYLPPLSDSSVTSVTTSQPDSPPRDGVTDVTDKSDDHQAD